MASAGCAGAALWSSGPRAPATDTSRSQDIAPGTRGGGFLVESDACAIGGAVKWSEQNPAAF